MKLQSHLLMLIHVFILLLDSVTLAWNFEPLAWSALEGIACAVLEREMSFVPTVCNSLLTNRLINIQLMEFGIDSNDQ